jgi:hypothetical protein
VLATASYAPTSALRIQVSGGATISGQLHMPDGRHDFAPGPSGALGVSYRLLSGMPFLALSADCASTAAAMEPSTQVRTAKWVSEAGPAQTASCAHRPSTYLAGGALARVAAAATSSDPATVL